MLGRGPNGFSALWYYIQGVTSKFTHRVISRVSGDKYQIFIFFLRATLGKGNFVDNRSVNISALLKKLKNELQYISKIAIL